MFRGGFYLAGFDLTTAQEGGGDPHSIPSVRLGYLRAKLNFSQPPQTDLTLLMFSESTALLEIPKTGKIKTSYVPK